MSIVIICYLNSAILYLYCIYQMFTINKVKTLCSSGVNWINWLTRVVICRVTLSVSLYYVQTPQEREG